MLRHRQVYALQALSIYLCIEWKIPIAHQEDKHHQLTSSDSRHAIGGVVVKGCWNLGRATASLVADALPELRLFYALLPRVTFPLRGCLTLGFEKRSACSALSSHLYPVIKRGTRRPGNYFTPPKHIRFPARPYGMPPESLRGGNKKRGHDTEVPCPRDGLGRC